MRITNNLMVLFWNASFLLLPRRHRPTITCTAAFLVTSGSRKAGTTTRFILSRGGPSSPLLSLFHTTSTTTFLEARRGRKSQNSGSKASSSSSSSTTTTTKIIMPRGVKKEHLPSKTCVVCNRPFTWRKKWERCWDEVTTCSKSCNQKRRRENQQQKQRIEQGNDEIDESSSAVLKNAGVTSSPQRTREASLGILGDDETLLAPLLSMGDMVLATSASLSYNLNGPSEDKRVQDATMTYDMQDDDDEDPRAARKAAKKAMKAQRRAKREGRDRASGQKPCDVCNKPVNLLVRCTIDASQQWNMVCGKCWHDVSGGVPDGDAQHPHYRYGGLWKNRARA